MKELPILMDTLSVQGILNGNKTQTRRPIKKWPPRIVLQRAVVGAFPAFHGTIACSGIHQPESNRHGALSVRARSGKMLGVKPDEFDWVGSPFGNPDMEETRLWVRETWAPLPQNYRRAKCQSQPRMYRADGEIVYWPAQHYPGYQDKPFEAWQCKEEYEGKPIKWRLSIHMPRWACRIVLEVKRVWVERVREISENDAEAEGVKLVLRDIGTSAPWEEFYTAALYVPDFVRRWDSIYADRGLGWDANPWVWACEFEIATP